jgi:hypothetical protein
MLCPTFNRRFVHQKRKLPDLFNHLVGLGKQRRWHGETERSGGLEIDHQFKFGRLQDRQVGRPLAFENPAGIDSSTDLLKEQLSKFRAVMGARPRLSTTIT